MKKVFSVILSLSVILVLSIQSFAVSDAQYGIETNVKNVTEENNIVFNVTVENINNYDVDDIFVTCTLPEGLTGNGELTKEIGTLKSGENASLKFSATASSASTLSLNSTSEAAPEKKFPVLAVISGIFSLLVIAAIIAFVFKKRSVKILSLMLCVSVLLPVLGGFLSFAASSTVSYNFNEEFEYNNKKYSAKFTVYLANDYTSRKNTVKCLNAETVTDATQDIEGTVSSDEKINSVSYKVYSEIDEGGVSFEGNAEVTGAHYKISETVLKPESNRIDLTCTTQSGKQFTDSVNITYDSSDLYDAKKSEISYDTESGRQYINSIVNVIFEASADEKQKESVLRSVKGEKVGYINGANMWQIKVPTATLEKLEEICEALNKLDFVSLAYTDFLEMDVEAIPNDPWMNHSWDESNPAGYNWNVEMIKALSAWDYDDYFSDIKLGLIDAGCNYNHEELSGRILFPSAEQKEGCDSQNHGTHVAGIMTATPNNGIGLSGIVWKSQAYMFDLTLTTDTTGMTTTKCYNGFVSEVESGAKVINMSVGTAQSTVLTTKQINNFAATSASYMNQLLTNGYDFIACQSSGNGNSSGVAVDASLNGMFCCVNENNTGLSTEMAKEIVDRIIVTGSMNSSCIQASTSNFGDNVDVVSPGVGILSSITSGYGLMSGTSMASPLSAACLGLIWSVNPELTGSQVTEIFLNSANNYRTASASVTGQTEKPVPNLKTAVEAAIATLEKPDFTKLDEAIVLIPTELSIYSESSIQALESASQAAKALNRSSASQEDVDTVTGNLLNAIYSLHVKFAPEYEFSVPSRIIMGSPTVTNVSFTCEAATDIVISFDKNISVGTQSTENNTTTISISGQSLTETGNVICTAHYTYNGMEYDTMRCIPITAFAEPLVATSITRTDKMGSYYNPSLYTYTTIKGTLLAENPSENSNNGYLDFSSNSFVSHSSGTNWGGYNIVGAASSNVMSASCVPKGYIFVDPNVYGDLSSVPSLQLCVGQYASNTRASAGTTVTEISTDNDNYSVNIGTNTALSSSATGYNSPLYYSINGAVPAETTTVRFAVTVKALSSTSSSTVYTTSTSYIDLVIIPATTADLLQALNYLNCSTIQSVFYSEDFYEAYTNNYMLASSSLYNPNQNQTGIDSIYTDLIDSYAALEFLGKASYTNLDSLLAQVDGIDSSLYTVNTLNKLYAACDDASQMCRDYFSSYQSVIDNTCTSINNLISSLLLCGDANADGLLDGNDAVIVSMIIAGKLTESDLDSDLYDAADANKNGIIDNTDYDILVQKGLLK